MFLWNVQVVQEAKPDLSTLFLPNKRLPAEQNQTSWGDDMKQIHGVWNAGSSCTPKLPPSFFSLPVRRDSVYTMGKGAGEGLA